MGFLDSEDLDDEVDTGKADAEPEVDTGEAADAGDTDGDEPEGDDDADEGSATAGAGKTVPLAALKDERRKRQEERAKREELQRRIDLLEAKFEAGRQSAPKEEPKEEKFDASGIYDDPSEVFERFKATLRADDNYAQRVADSEEDARLTWDDYDEVVNDADLNRLISSNPGMQDALKKSRFPAKLAYKGILKMRKAEAEKKTVDPEAAQENAKLRKELAALRKRLGMPVPSGAASRAAGSGQGRRDDDDDVFRSY